MLLLLVYVFNILKLQGLESKKIIANIRMYLKMKIKCIECV